MSLKRFLCLDIESIAEPSAEAWLPEPTAPSNYRDAEKIAAAIAEKRAAQRDRMALDPWASRPCVITTQTEAQDAPTVHLCHDDADLRVALASVWCDRLAQHGDIRPFIGFRVRTFDLPHLAHHARRLAHEFPRVDLRRYGNTEVIDLYDILCDDEVEHVISRSLKSTCRVYGVNVPEDDADGRDVAALWAANDLTAIAAHCCRDVERTVALARRVGVITAAKKVAA